MSKYITKTLITLAAVLIILTAIIYFLRLKERNDYINIATPLIEKIEAYIYTNHKLPSDVYEIGEEEKMGIGPYYEKLNDSCYRIFFSIGFDDYFEYSSETKMWKYKP